MTELKELARRIEKRHALSSKLKRFDLTVGCVLLVFAFLYYVDIAYVIVPWLSYSVPGVLNAMVLTATAGTALGCYFCCMFTDPGRVPKGWSPDEEQQAAIQEVKRKDGAARFCKKCSEHKPPRSHHCRVCERCIPRMDHHCPWVNNCIGHANYRSFFLLLVYCSLALIHTTCLLGAHSLHIAHSSKTSRVIRVGLQAAAHVMTRDPDKHLMMHIGLQAFAFFVALLTTIAVVMLLMWHIRMVAGNKTTIEAAEGVTAQIKAAAMGQAMSKHPYDLGIWANVQEVLGVDEFFWFIPSWQPTPGGLSYPTAFEVAQLGF